MRDFSRLLEKTKLKSVSEIPGFPTKSFRELESAEKSGAISIGVDRTAANSLAPMARGPLYSIWIFSLMAAPFAIAVLVPIWGVIIGRYLLLLSAPRYATSNPYLLYHNLPSSGRYLPEICVSRQVFQIVS